MLKHKLFLLLAYLIMLGSVSTAFAEIEPNWYWVHSDDYFNFYIDTNNISVYNAPSTNIIYKKVIVKSIPYDESVYSPYDTGVFEFKKENNINYCIMLSVSKHDSNQNLISSNDTSSLDKWREIDKSKVLLSKIAALL